MRISGLIFSAVFLLTMCSQSTWNKIDNGVVIRLKPGNPGNVNLMKLEVVSDEIIHVAASAAGKFSQEKSLS